jgi:glycosyltransferase involved in cell wall biosynthesis
MSMLVTIILPAYNDGHMIGETLSGLRSQTYSDWECVIVDDGSSDDTKVAVAPILDSDPRFRYVFQANQGLAGARNTGLRVAKGGYIQFLDSDDLIEPTKIERQLAYLVDHPEVDIVYGDSRTFYREDVREGPCSTWGEPELDRPRVHGSGPDVVLSLLRYTFIVHAPLLRASVVRDVGPFDTSLRFSEDWHFWVRCALAGKTIHHEPLPGTLAMYRRHASSMSANPRALVEGNRKLRAALDRILGDPEARALNRRLDAAFQGHAGVREVESGHRWLGSKQFFRAGTLSDCWRERGKWLFCAAAALVAPRERMAHLTTTPTRDLLRSLVARA